MTNFVDLATIFGAKVTQDGFLVANCHVARCGVQRYLGIEVGLPEHQYIDVYRPVESVFDTNSLQSFSHVPVTLDHPHTPVTAENWKQLAVGEVSAEVLRDGERLKIPLVLKDARAIDHVVAGKRQLSMGYAADLDFQPGVTADGTPYQAVQRNIRANHVAIVDQARAGPQFRIGDSQGIGTWGAAPLSDSSPSGDSPMNTLNTVTTRGILVDGITIQTTDQGAEAIARLQASLADSASKLTDAETAHAAALTVKDAEIGALKVKLADAEKSVPTAEALDVLARKRAGLIGDAQRLAKDLKVDGLTDEAIRRAAVTAVYGAELVKDAPDAEVAGMFKAALGNAKRDPVRGALMPAPRQTLDADEDHGQAAYEARLRDAWKGGAAKTA